MDIRSYKINQIVFDKIQHHFFDFFTILSVDCVTINLYLSVAPVHLGFGVDGARGHVILLRDITREKSLEEEPLILEEVHEDKKVKEGTKTSLSSSKIKS